MGNPFKSVTKAVKKITGGIKKVFGGVQKIGSKIVDGLRSVGREIKRFAKTDLGKIVIAAALIYVGGAAMLAYNSAGATSFAAALSQPAAVGAQLGSAVGIGSGTTGAGATGATTAGAATTGGVTATTSGAAIPGMTTVGAAEAAGVSAGLGTTGTGIGLNGAAATTGATAGGSTALAGGGAAAGGLLSNPMVQYGAVMAGGNAISGAMQGKAAADGEKEAEKARQRYIDGNRVPDVNFDNLAGFQYNPMTGESEGGSTEAFLPENLRVNTNLSKQYTTQGLLKQGAV